MTGNSTPWMSEGPKKQNVTVRWKLHKPSDTSMTKVSAWKWTWKARVSFFFIFATVFFCSSSCEGSTTDCTLCALSDLYSQLSQILSEHHLVCRVGVFDDWRKGGDAAQRERSPPPRPPYPSLSKIPLRELEDMEWRWPFHLIMCVIISWVEASMF